MNHIILTGQHNTVKIFTTELEQTAREQIETLLDQAFTAGSIIRIMPDVHAGAGSTIGTTMTIKDKAVPNMVGVDIGCGMETVRLAEKNIDLDRLDRLIHSRIPAGYNIRKRKHHYIDQIDIAALRCRDGGKNDKNLKLDRAGLSIGTLGGGNHFIEVNQDEEGNLYIVIHSGSRHLGLQVALHYQKLAGRMNSHLPPDLAYLEGEALEDYLHDMRIMQRFAKINRKAMMDEIVTGMRVEVLENFTTIHNYIDLESKILRKGAVSAKAGEKILIPINMRDGSLICVGKGNPEWNMSAPHGAGRVMSRREAKRTLSLDELVAEMDGIYSSTLNRSILDEAPSAYKQLDDILPFIGDTVEVLKQIKPLYNFKSAGD